MSVQHLTHMEEGGSYEEKGIFGFWAYIMSDCLLFACLFAAYMVLSGNTFGGPSGAEIFNMPFVLVETLVLLTSSFTYGLVSYHSHHTGRKKSVLTWLAVTALLGVVFVGMEISEFSTLLHEGFGPDRSAFLSAFFTLLGVHGLHVFAGIIWMGNLFFQVLTRGVTERIGGKLSSLGLFWHFLDIVWIFIFTLVYLMGVIS